MENIINKHYILPSDFSPVLKLRNYVHLGVVRNYLKGDSIVLPGENIQKIIFVLSGKLSISFMNEDGRQKLMFYAVPYTFADRLFPIEECFVHVVSEEKSSVCFFEKEQLLTILQQDKELLSEFITCYASKCFYFMHETKEIVLYKPSVRVLRLLYVLCLTQGNLVNNVYEIDIKISQRAISEITGVHYVTISKIFKYLKNENIVHKTTDKIIISNLLKLKALIEDWMNF